MPNPIGLFGPDRFMRGQKSSLSREALHVFRNFLNGPYFEENMISAVSIPITNPWFKVIDIRVDLIVLLINF